MPSPVQRAVISQVTTEEREEVFSLAIAILTTSFPDTHSADVGHQVASWVYCQRRIPHIESILEKSEEFKIFEDGNQSFAELLVRCSWYSTLLRHLLGRRKLLIQTRYLYERENYNLAQSYVDLAVKRFTSKDTLAYASAIDLRGLIELDICHPAKALGAFEEAYKMRREILADNDLFLAASQVNIGLASTELGELEKAHDYLQQSINLRLMHNSDRIGNSYSKMASFLLRMGQVDQAEAMLKSCPSLRDFSDEGFLNTGNPRLSGYVPR